MPKHNVCTCPSLSARNNVRQQKCLPFVYWTSAGAVAMQSQRIRNSFRQKKGCVNREKKNSKRFVYGLAAAVKKPPSSFSWHELSTWTASGWARLWLAGHSLVAPIWSRGIFRQRGLNPPRFLFFLSTSPRSLHTHLCVCSFFYYSQTFSQNFTQSDPVKS
jgi:hypothetical protein